MFSERLRLLLREHNLTQKELARIAGVSQVAVVKWLNNMTKDISAVYLLKIAKHLGVSADWLIFGTGSKELSSAEKSNYQKVPLIPLERVKEYSSGIETETEEYYFYPKALDKSEEKIFCIRNHSDLMTPKYREGDILFVRQNEKFTSGSTVIVVSDNDKERALIRDVLIDGDKTYFTVSNPVWSNAVKTCNSPADYRIVGTVIGRFSEGIIH